MRCFYEVLGVEKSADLSELKKAYYKVSLKWHPDKNQTEDATSKFQEIQEAYRVLSDAQERAWYDRHRNEILRGGQGGIAGEYKEERLNVFQFFSRSCFKEFDDELKGFYTVYRQVFDEIAAEELRASDSVISSDSEDDKQAVPVKSRGSVSSKSFPSFGKADSDFESVVRPFYAFWEGFCTRKSYSWVEPYDTRRLSSRLERRAADAENRKARDAAKKERNEEIRQLVAFVHRRDKRVEAERERLLEAEQNAHARNRERAHKTRERNAADLERDWASEMATGGIAAQWAEELEAELARIEARLQASPPPSPNSREIAPTIENSDSEVGSTADEDETENECAVCNKSFASAGALMSHNASKKHRKQVELLRQILSKEDDDRIAPDATETDANAALIDAYLSNTGDVSAKTKSDVKLTKRAKKSRRRQQREAEKLESDLSSSVLKVEGESTVVISGETTTEGHPAVVEESALGDSVPHPMQTFKCLICTEEFPSKNKLFGHIKESGHAVLKNAPSTAVKRNRKK